MFALLDNHFSLGLTATALIVLRILMMPFIFYNLGWSFKGFKQLIGGAVYPTSLYQSVVFFSSLGLMGYHVMAVLGRTAQSWSEPYSLALQCLFFLAMLIATIGRRIAVTVDFERFYWLFEQNNLDVAVRIAELNQLDPEYTEGVLDLAENNLAIQLARRTSNR